jgi:hypothetical protein
MANENCKTPSPLTMTPDELFAWRNLAAVDLVAIAQSDPNSERHEACFAALYVICEEMNRRGLKSIDVSKKSANAAIGAAK